MARLPDIGAAYNGAHQCHVAWASRGACRRVYYLPQDLDVANDALYAALARACAQVRAMIATPGKSWPGLMRGSSR